MSKMSRRGFVKGTAIGGAAFMISGTKSSGNIIGANDRVRIGVVGTNGRGQSHIDGWLKQPSVELAYLVDVDQDILAKRLKSVEERTEGKFATKGIADVRNALEDKSLDAISVATPNHWHSLITIWAAQAGKSVYVEKPMSHDVVEGRVAWEAQKKYNVVVQHGTQGRSDAKRAGLHEAIQAGKFGRLKISTSHWPALGSRVGPRGVTVVVVLHADSRNGNRRMCRCLGDICWLSAMNDLLRG